MWTDVILHVDTKVDGCASPLCFVWLLFVPPITLVCLGASVEIPILFARSFSLFNIFRPF